MGEIKVAYITELGKRLSTLDNKLLVLRSRIKKSNPKHSEKLFIEMQKLREQSDVIRDKLQALSEIDHPNWTRLKHELDDAWLFLQKSAASMALGLEHQWDDL